MKLDINIDINLKSPPGQQNNGLLALISAVLTKLDKIIMADTQIQETVDANNAKIDALTDQVAKIGAEISKLLEGQVDKPALLAKLKVQTDKLQALGDNVQSADDLNEDGTPVDDGSGGGNIDPVTPV